MQYQEAISRVADVVLADIQELVSDIFDAVRVIPGYASGRRPGELEDVRAAIREVASLILVCVSQERRPREAELRQLAAVGMQRARQSIPRDALSRSIDLAQRRGFARLIATIESAIEPPYHADVIAGAWAQVSELVMLIRHEMIEAYELETDRIAGRMPGREAAAFVERVLSRRWDSDAEIRSHASAAGVSLGKGPGLAMLVPVSKPDQGTLLASIHRSALVAMSPAIGGSNEALGDERRRPGRAETRRGKRLR